MLAIRFRSGYIATVCALAAASVMLMSGVAGAAPYSVAPVSEYTLLPKFCWGHFNDDLKGEQYYIPGCGVGTNHYCDGLLDLQRAKKTKNVHQKKPMLARAKRDTLYTIGWLEREGVMGSCPISPHVKQTLQEIELQYQIYHIK